MAPKPAPDSDSRVTDEMARRAYEARGVGMKAWKPWAELPDDAKAVWHRVAAALAARPEQEPVAWNCIYPTYGHFTLKEHEAKQAIADGAEVRPLFYAAPLAAQPGREDAPKLLEEAKTYATSLAMGLWKKHWQQDAPDWRPLPDLFGALTQVDNMVCGLTRLDAYEAAIAERDAERAAKGYVFESLAKAESALTAAQASAARMREALERLQEAMERINQILSPGSRTFDELIRDAGYACDIARAALKQLALFHSISHAEEGR